MRDCREIVKQHFTISEVLTIPAPGSALPPGSGPDTMHYSFDFAQQVHYPHNPLQPGPMYFKTARKCAVFGICCEGIPRQINYLIDEASDVGKGANTVISLLHHFLEHHGLGEINVGLHADNCVGQNKKQCYAAGMYKYNHVRNIILINAQFTTTVITFYTCCICSTWLGEC